MYVKLSVMGDINANYHKKYCTRVITHKSIRVIIIIHTEYCRAYTYY